MARHKGRDRLAAEIKDLLAVDAENRVALLEILDLLAKPQRVDVAVGRVIAAGARALLRFTVGELLAPRRETIGGRRWERVEQLLQDRFAVADERDVNIARRQPHLLRIDVDACDLRLGAEARR